MIRDVTWYAGTSKSAALGEFYMQRGKYVLLAEITFVIGKFVWRAYHPTPAVQGHWGAVYSDGTAFTQLEAAKAINHQFELWGFKSIDLSPFSPPSYEEEEEE